MKVKNASKKDLDNMMVHVKRFDSGEFVTVLEKFTKKDYIVYAANGNGSVQTALRAVKALHPTRKYLTRAISKTHRIVVRL